MGHIQANLEDELVQEALRKASLRLKRAVCMWCGMCLVRLRVLDKYVVYVVFVSVSRRMATSVGL